MIGNFKVHFYFSNLYIYRCIRFEKVGNLLLHRGLCVTCGGENGTIKCHLTVLVKT